MRAYTRRQMKALILHTLPPPAVGTGRVAAEFDLDASARLVAGALPEAVVRGTAGEPGEILRILDTHAPDVVFNLCEAPLGRPDLEPQVAALFEWRSQRFTGSGSESLALCRRKDRAKAVLAAAGIPVPAPGAGRFPCIVKPAGEDGSAGIDAGSVCANAAELERRLASSPGVPMLVEEFLQGREFAVSLWGEAEPADASIGEFLFRDGVRLNTYASKWLPDSPDYRAIGIRYEALGAPLEAAILDAASGAWRALQVRGYARVDVRCDAEGRPRVIDVNPNPALSPGEGLHRAVLAAGWDWVRFVTAQLEWAMR